MKCINKNEGHRELIGGFQNLRKDVLTERPTVSTSVTNCVYLQPQLNLYVTHSIIHFFQFFMHYTAVYQQ